MREIKFRAWDKEGGRMVYLEPYLYLNHKGNFEYVDGPDLETSERDYPVMQFTGLKDKNDKEIYEGDIIKIKPSDGMNLDLIEEIKWVDQNNWLGKNCPVNGFVNHESIYKIKPEIIGNIYENPELLK